jgi:hypothetical protein
MGHGEAVMTLVVCVLLAALCIDLIHAFVKPLKNHKFCGGRGLDPYCNFSGKVPRFGARWVRRKVWREYR